MQLLRILPQADALFQLAKNTIHNGILGHIRFPAAAFFVLFDQRPPQSHSLLRIMQIAAAADARNHFFHFRTAFLYDGTGVIDKNRFDHFWFPLFCSGLHLGSAFGTERMRPIKYRTTCGAGIGRFSCGRRGCRHR